MEKNREGMRVETPRPLGQVAVGREGDGGGSRLPEGYESGVHDDDETAPGGGGEGK